MTTCLSPLTNKLICMILANSVFVSGGRSEAAGPITDSHPISAHFFVMLSFRAISYLSAVSIHLAHHSFMVLEA